MCSGMLPPKIAPYNVDCCGSLSLFFFFVLLRACEDVSTIVARSATGGNMWWSRTAGAPGQYLCPGT